MEQEQVIRELTEFATQTTAVLQDHKQVLQRHEQNLQAEFRCVESHRDAIAALSKDVQAIGELVNSMQRCLLRILSELGMLLPGDDPALGKIN
jgi:uncharacterized protein (DUF3084 family)